MSDRDVEVVRQLFAAQGDVEAVYALFDPGIEWEDVSGLWAADWGKPSGTEELRQTFRRWYEIFNEVEFEAEDFTEAGEDLLVTVRIEGRARLSDGP